MKHKKCDYMIYGVYEKGETEECVFVGTMNEIAEKFKTTKNAVYRDITGDRKLKCKYIVKKLGKESEL